MLWCCDDLRQKLIDISAPQRGDTIFWKYNFFSQKCSFWVVEYSFGIFKVGMSAADKTGTAPF